MKSLCSHHRIEITEPRTADRCARIYFEFGFQVPELSEKLVKCKAGSSIGSTEPTYFLSSWSSSIPLWDSTSPFCLVRTFDIAPQGPYIDLICLTPISESDIATLIFILSLGGTCTLPIRANLGSFRFLSLSTLVVTY